jgi:uncharacterized protein CbrC (UPF0167 family)
MTTFSDIGFRFPLFDAPVDDASGFVGASTCGLCNSDAEACFELGIGCDVVVRCSSCGVDAGLDADDREDGVCDGCEAPVPFPDVPDELVCCFACLRTGRAAISKDTELGMVSWEQAVKGVTHGVPGLNHPDFDMIPTDSDWVLARLDKDTLFELIRTPTYSTIQGERWLFCCKKPMVFVGAWSRHQFAARAPDGDGKAFLASVIGEQVPGLWEDELHDVTGIYVFSCPICGRLKGHWDVA